MNTSTASRATRSLRSRDPSDSKTWMTKNYLGPSLHGDKIKEREGKVQQNASAAPALDDAAILALPESDEDENDENDVPVPQLNRPLEPVPPLSKKRKLSPVPRTRKYKRGRLTDTPDLSDLTSNDSPEIKNVPRATELNMLSSSASQKRKKLYKREVPVPERQQRQGSTVLKKTAEIPDAVPEGSRTSEALRVPAIEAEESLPPKKTLKTLKLPEMNFVSSGASQATSTSAHPSQEGQSPVSPASTTATSPILDKLAEDDRTSSVCPYCDKEVKKILLDDPNIDLLELRYAPVRQQQKFCHEHSLADARAFYEAKRYPEMNWLRLKHRVSKHVPKLKHILQREAKSHFLQQIDDRLAELTNRRQLQRFLDQQGKDIDAIPPSYYGPKGSQIMAEVIAAGLSQSLVGKNVDETVKTLGIGPYVQFVLVPEVTTLLVMEDMKVSEAAARAIMTESSHVGMLIHPEDEVVLRQDEED